MKGIVLVVDDEEQVRAIIRRALEELDCQVVEAADGADVMGLVEKHRPALVLMDIHMPEIDGISATDEICRQYPETQVIIVSGDVSDARVKTALERGAVAFIGKPVNLADLQTLVLSRLPAGD